MESRSRRTSESPFRGHHVAKDATVRIGSEAQRSALSYYCWWSVDTSVGGAYVVCQTQPNMYINYPQTPICLTTVSHSVTDDRSIPGFQGRTLQFLIWAIVSKCSSALPCKITRGRRGQLWLGDRSRSDSRDATRSDPLWTFFKNRHGHSANPRGAARVEL